MTAEYRTPILGKMLQEKGTNHRWPVLMGHRAVSAHRESVWSCSPNLNTHTRITPRHTPSLCPWECLALRLLCRSRGDRAAGALRTGRGQGRCSASCDVQDNPPQRRVTQSTTSTVLRPRSPGVCPTETRTDVPQKSCTKKKVVYKKKSCTKCLYQCYS